MSNTIRLAVGEARNNEAAVTSPGDTFRDQISVGVEGPLMIVIPDGEFLMGAPAGEVGSFDDERPQHSVTVEEPLCNWSLSNHIW